jgi:hypothetical protein
MSKLIIDTAQLREHLGTLWSASTDISKGFNTFLEMAESRYIVRAIGSQMYDELCAQNSEGNVSEKNKPLIKLIQDAVAFYAYGLRMPFAAGTDGDLGLQESEGERTKAMRISLIQKRAEAAPEYASQAIEDALTLLFSQSDDFPTWAESPTAIEARRSFIRSGRELGFALPASRGSHRIFLALREYVAEAERRTLIGTLGKEYYTDLKARHREGALTAAELGLLPYIQRALAHTAYSEALITLIIVHQPDTGLRVLSEFDGINNRRALTPRDSEEYRREFSNLAETYRRELKAFLDENAAEFPDYQGNVRTRRFPPDNSKYKSAIRLR